MDRRGFVKNWVLSTGIFTPSFQIWNKRSNRNDIIIGHGAYQYRVVPGWGAINNNPVKDCHEMVEDRFGRLILLTNETKNNVLIFDKSGKIIEYWGNSYPGAHGLTIAEEGEEQFLFITDTERHKIFKTDLKGNVILELGYPREIPEYESAEQYKPTEIAVNPQNGEFYVADGYGLNYIIKYSDKGHHLSHFGGKGWTEDQFMCCHGVAFDHRRSEPRLIITDRSKMKFKYFNLDGEYLSTIDLPGSFVCRPVIFENNIYAAVYRSTAEDIAYSGYITIINEEDKIISTPGGTRPEYADGELLAQRKEDPSQVFMHPHDICIDEDHNLYIPQWASKKTFPVKLERV